MVNQIFSYKGKAIPVARIDMSKKNSFIEKERLEFNDLPVVLMVFDGNFVAYKDSMHNFK